MEGKKSGSTQAKASRGRRAFFSCCRNCQKGKDLKRKNEGTKTYTDRAKGLSSSPGKNRRKEVRKVNTARSSQKED